ncbi:hypothetical protein [Photorhabdus australis]|nr:hypothetical protein [Photorhabdus australis]
MKTFLFRHKKNDKKYFIHEITEEGKNLKLICSGKFKLFFDVMFSFVMYKKTFIFGHDKNTRWHIYEMNENGTLYREVSSGYLDDFYPNLFSYQIDDNVYIFGQSKKKKWFIREMSYDHVPSLDNKDKSSGKWNAFYPSMFSYSINDNTYLFAQTDEYGDGGYYWFVQQLFPNGRLDTTVIDGNYKNWHTFYPILFSFVLKGKVYIFCHTNEYAHGGYYWFIQEILVDGKLGPIVDGNGKNWRNFWKVLPYTINDKMFIYGQNRDNNRIFFQEIIQNGTLANEEKYLDDSYYYDVQLSFSTNNF